MSGRHEYPDPTPVEWPPHLKRPETLAEQIQRLVRTEVSRAAQEAGFESFEESDDFDVDDDTDLFSEHELTEEQEEVDSKELTRREEAARIASEVRNRKEKYESRKGVRKGDADSPQDREGDEEPSPEGREVGASGQGQSRMAGKRVDKGE